MRKKISIEDELTEEQAEQIWNERLEEAKLATKKARQFIKKHKLADEDLLFLAALNQLLGDLVAKRS